MEKGTPCRRKVRAKKVREIITLDEQEGRHCCCVYRLLEAITRREKTGAEKGKLEEIPCGVDKEGSQSMGGRSGFSKVDFPLYQEGL